MVARVGFEPTKHYAQNLKSCPFDQTWVSRLSSMHRLLPFNTCYENARLNIVQKVVISCLSVKRGANQKKINGDEKNGNEKSDI